MLQTIIKRSGERETFQNSKTNGWVLRIGHDILDRMDWSSIVIQARNSAPEEMTSQEWQLSLINLLTVRGSQDDGYPYMLMAGRLYTIYQMKKIHGDGYPTLKSLHEFLIKKGLQRDMGYLEGELSYLNDYVINHEKNMEMNWTQVEQYNLRYSLKDFVTRETHETPQFSMMRMAMAVYENEEPIKRLEKVAELYTDLSDDILNPPSPNYSALGTTHYGMASCCLIAATDTAESIQIAGMVGYQATKASGGLGISLSTRAPGDPVAGGRVQHAGRLNYVTMLQAETNANKQGARGGAVTFYDTVYSPEIELSIMMQNTRTPAELRNRNLNIAYTTNSFFTRKAVKGEDYFTFTEFSAPDLYKAFFKADQSEFEELYAKYEADPSFKKNYRNAKTTLVWIMGQEIEQSTLFWANPQEMNTHTSFKDYLTQSNLCVAPETFVLTDTGIISIGDEVGETVNAWNGEIFSPVEIVKTSNNEELLTVKTEFGFIGRFTKMHKWYIDVDGLEMEVRTKDLKPGMKMVAWAKPTEYANEARTNEYLLDLVEVEIKNHQTAVAAAASLQYRGINSRIHERAGKFTIDRLTDGEQDSISSVTDHGDVSPTYCFNEPLKHRGVFNGMFTGQCMEVIVPTKAFLRMEDLFDAEGDPSKGEVGICNIGSIPIHRLPFNPSNSLLGFERYKRAVRSMMNIIDYAIDNSEYRFPAIATQAKSRRNCSVGMSGVATLFAKLNLKFNTDEGRRVWHVLNERHMYACIEVALEMGKERGNAPWMNGPKNDGIHGTKWVDGWMPIDTYKKTIDTVVDSTLHFDWEDLRGRVVENKGIRFSSLVAHMPGEQATRKGTGSNSVYPVTGLSVDLSDGNSAMPWAALDNDLIGDQYQICYGLSRRDQSIHYGIGQKFTDQGISADSYEDMTDGHVIDDKYLLNAHLDRVRFGPKTGYYVRSYTEQGGKQKDIEVQPELEPTTGEADDLMSRIAANARAMQETAGASCTLDGACGT